MTINGNYLVEEEDYIEQSDAPGERLVISLGSPRGAEIVPLAFSVTCEMTPVSVDGISISWTKEAQAAFWKMREASKVRDPEFERNLPYAYLRSFMEVGLTNVLRIEPGMGLDKYGLDPSRDAPAPFAYVSAPSDDVRKTLQPILDDWLVQVVMPYYAEPGKIPEPLRQRLLDLSHSNALLSLDPVHSQILPWKAGPTGTAMPPDRRSFQLLVDQAARLLAGQELFKGAGPMRRFVVGHRGSQSTAELVSRPIQMGDRGLFSLVLALEVITFPSIAQPILRMEVHKRRWVKRLSNRVSDGRRIRGTVFSEKHDDKAFSFHLRFRKCEDGERRWDPDNAYEALKRELSLPFERMDGHQIVSGAASTGCNRVLLVHRDKIAEGDHGIKVGVPELDKLEAFQESCHALQSIGLVPFRGYTQVKSRHSKDQERFARTINAPTLLGGALEALEKGSNKGLTPQYLKTLGEDEIDALLRRLFKVGLGEISRGHRIIRYESALGQEESNQAVDLDGLIVDNRNAVERMYPGEEPLLVIFYEDGADVSLRILRSVVQLLWGDALEVVCNRLPRDVHGSRNSLPGKDLPDIERSGLRLNAWKSLAQQIGSQKRRAFCLVMARDWYKDSDGVSRRDDGVNKPAARRALASIGSASVQYLLPPKTSRESGTMDVANFLYRAQAALKDLISAHSGRIEGVRESVVRCLGDQEGGGASMPREIIGITIVRKSPGRSRGNIEPSFLPIAVRIDVETGRCDMCCAYEGPRDLTVTQWEHFPIALATISRLSPARLAENREIGKTRFMRFVEQIISASVEEGAQPVIIIDSSNAVYLWGWLADQRIDPSRITIGEKEWMHEAWKGARIIRVRQDLAPGVVEPKEEALAFTSLQDERPARDLVGEIRLQKPTSPFGLYRLESQNPKSGSVCYFSVGRKTLHMKRRGVSCYRTTTAALPQRDGNGQIRNKANLRVCSLTTREPWTKQWPTPNPLEIVVSLRQASDDPDRLAELVERLRYGFGHYSEWTSLPAPLFFERVVREYISDFSEEDGGDSDSSELYSE